MRILTKKQNKTNTENNTYCTLKIQLGLELKRKISKLKLIKRVNGRVSLYINARYIFVLYMKPKTSRSKYKHTSTHHYWQQTLQDFESWLFFSLN